MDDEEVHECPVCGTGMTGFFYPHDVNARVTPKAHDTTICAGCSCILVMNIWREFEPMTDEDFQELSDSMQHALSHLTSLIAARYSDHIH